MRVSAVVLLIRRFSPIWLLFLGGCSLSRFPLLDPSGPIGRHESQLIAIAFLLMLIPVVPVIVMTLWFARHYRASNDKATYRPRWGHSNRVEIVVWSVPALIVLCLAILTWITTHQLDPYRPLASSAKAVRIEAISLNWKWLFIYPDEHVATINEVAIPTGIPVSFQLTSDTVMTSFFIPRLGTQIYAMAGMKTRLHLMADKTGTFTGWNSQLSGEGFAGMHFKTLAMSRADYEAWLKKVRQSPRVLDAETYKQLAAPSAHHPVVYYSSVQPPDLFTRVISKYMHGPMHTSALTPRTAAATGN